MSQEHKDERPTDNLPAEGQEALTALRSVWSAQHQSSADIDESCGNTKSCKNMTNVGFQGLADDVDTPTEANPSVGNNLRAAWKTKLEREGKLSTGGGSVRDLVFGSSDPNKE